MVIGWICSRDLLKTSREVLHDVHPAQDASKNKAFSALSSEVAGSLAPQLTHWDHNESAPFDSYPSA